MKFPVRSRALTTPDLVLLSLLAERPMHGYQANLELERRQVRDWAGVSRPQVYYSIGKLAKLGLVRSGADESPAAGPDRCVYQTSAKGRAALAGALDREDWTTARDRPPFLTWLALSWQASPETCRRQVACRRGFLEEELAREQATLRAIRAEVGHPFHEAIWMVSLAVAQIRVELRWLRKLAGEIDRRAPAGRPPGTADQAGRHKVAGPPSRSVPRGIERRD
jgi:DNA-binding PadR family transcriptional regulator